MPLSVVEVAYQYTVDRIVDPISNPSTVSKESEEAYLPAWVENSLYSYECLDMVLPSNKTILEVMSGRDKICEDIHHRSYFLPDTSRIENQEFHVRLVEDVDVPINPLPKEGIFDEGNMENIYVTIPINIFVNPDVIKNVHIGANCSLEEIAIYAALFKEFCDVFSWSYEKMPGIDPSIMEHEIRTYHDATSVRQNIRPVNPCKVTVVKAEVEKLLKVGFIYLIALMEWVSNPVLVDKKQGTIHVCT